MNLINDFPAIEAHRIIWINSQAQDKWEGAITQISQEVQLMEIRSVLEGNRQCATITIKPEMLVKYHADYPDLIFSVLRNTAPFEGFSHRHGEPEPGKPFLIHCVMGKTKEVVNEFRQAFAGGNHKTQGRLLGFPECCTEFFTQAWKGGYFDPIWQAALNSGSEGSYNRLEVKNAHPYSNPLLRYIGIRIGFHIPHSFCCEKTIEIARNRMRLMDENLRPIAEAMLSMPMEWDVNHGIAQIKTPIFWIITGSIPVEENYRVCIKGNFTPREVSDAY